MSQCCACGVKNPKGVSLHRFPADEVMLVYINKTMKIWIKFIFFSSNLWAENLKNYKILNIPPSERRNYRVCSSHFEKNMFRDKRKLILKKDALPTLFKRGKGITKLFYYNNIILFYSKRSTTFKMPNSNYCHRW